MSHAVLEAPADEAALADAVRDGGPWRIEGGGTRAIGRPVEAAALSTRGFSAVSLYEPHALTVVAGAGAALADVEALLAAENQRLPFEPPDLRALLGVEGESTLGGVVAVNAAGPRRIQAGACRDSLIGVRVVDGQGRVIKNGGRVMKNVTGYDLVKLMSGAHGTLGVLTEVSFKLLPAPEATATVALSGLDDAAAVAALSAALGSPFDVTGAAHLPGEATLARLEGFEASVAYRADRLRAALAPFGAAEIVRDDPRWAAVRDVARFVGRDGAVWRVSVKPSDGPAVAADLAGVALDRFYDWGGGLLWLLTADEGDAGAAAVRAAVDARGGHATLVRAAPRTRARVAPFHPEPAPVAALADALRRKFDPHGKLNPGRMAA